MWPTRSCCAKRWPRIICAPGDWSKAAAAYPALESRLSAPALAPTSRTTIELPVKLLPLAKDNPPMTVDPCDPFTMQASEDPLGLLDIPVFVDADSKSWMLDPTSPFNLIDRATAREVGLKISDEAATIRTLTGRPIQVHMAVIPRFTIGGRLTLHNMTVFVFDDADYYFPHSQYQVEGVLGYPALAALGSITVTDEDIVQVRPAKADRCRREGRSAHHRRAVFSRWRPDHRRPGRAQPDTRRRPRSRRTRPARSS